jgi:hypothetical protein
LLGVIALLHGVLPFLALLPGRARAAWGWLAGVAALVFLMRLAEALWLTAPGYPGNAATRLAMGVAAIAGVGIAWGAMFLYYWHAEGRGRGL